MKLIEKTDTQVNYASLKVSFLTFDEQVLALYEEDKVKEYITLGIDQEVVEETTSEDHTDE